VAQQELVDCRREDTTASERVVGEFCLIHPFRQSVISVMEQWRMYSMYSWEKTFFLKKKINSSALNVW